VADIVKYLRGEGWWVLKTHGSAFQRAGIPDLIAIRDSKVLWLEVKRPGKQPTKLQARTIDKLIDVGACVDVVYSVDDVRDFAGAVQSG